MLGQNDGNPYLSPHGRGFIMPQVENSSYMPPQGHAANPIQNLANLTRGISGMSYGAFYSIFCIIQSVTELLIFRT